MNLSSFVRGGSLVVSRRNFSSSRRHKGLTLGEKLSRRLGLATGLGSAYYFHGDVISKLEAKRQKLFAEYLRHSEGIVDLRHKMWPGVREKTEPARRLWSGVKEKIWTGRVV